MNPTNSGSQAHPTGERRAELERIKAAAWPPGESAEERAERVRVALEKFRSRPRIEVDGETLKWIFEAPEVEDTD